MYRLPCYLTGGLLTAFALTLAIVATTTPAFAQDPALTAAEEQNIDAYVSLLRQDVDSEKVAIIGHMMHFSPDEASSFWPLYSAYSKELSGLGDQRLALIKDYAANYETMTDAKADELINRALDLQQQRTALKRKHYDAIKAVMGSKLAARFLQVEDQLLLLVDLQVSSSLPVLQ